MQFICFTLRHNTREKTKNFEAVVSILFIIYLLKTISGLSRLLSFDKFGLISLSASIEWIYMSL